MINSVRLLSLLALCAMPLTAGAQNLLHVKFRGVCYETNAAGKVTTRVVNERTLLQEIAQDAGNLNPTGWALAYHIGGNPLGDTLEVINANTGQTLDTYLGFYFGEDSGLGRMALKGSTVQKTVDYLYTKQNSHSMGAAFLTKRELRPGLMYITGPLRWVMAPQGNKGVRVYSGILRTRTPWNFTKPTP